jgi:hypothetical protein
MGEDSKSRPALGKETKNGLEDPKDRRSAGRHGNQYVCLRRAEIGRISPSGLQ